jgi:chemotaxis protein methyltransferase CheR
MGIPMTGADVALFSAYVARLSGIVLDERKRYLLESRLGDVLRDSGCATWSELLARATTRAGSALERRIVDAVSTHETFFFREPKTFDALRADLAPAALARAGGRPIEIWSAGCSTGQEAYSIAITLAPILAGRPARILGSDISEAAVASASRGEFTALEIGRGLDAATLARSFTRAGSSYVAAPELRALCRFEVDNLLAPRARGPFDLVFCRNVLIYFSPADKQRALDAILDRLAPDGALVMGASESILAATDRVRRVESRGATYYVLRGR